MPRKKLPAVLAALAASVVVAAPAQAAISAPVDAHSGQKRGADAASSEEIIAVLIGLEAPRPFTPPLGTDKGSFIDASMIYGSTGVYQHNQTDLEF